MGVKWNQIWSPQKWQRAEKMRADGYRDDQIAREIGLTESQVTNKFTNMAYFHKRSARKQVSCEALDERDALFALPRTVTESICGDPLPGRSALDKLRQGHER